MCVVSNLFHLHFQSNETFERNVPLLTHSDGVARDQPFSDRGAWGQPLRSVLLLRHIITLSEKILSYHREWQNMPSCFRNNYLPALPNFIQDNLLRHNINKKYNVHSYSMVCLCRHACRNYFNVCVTAVFLTARWLKIAWVRACVSAYVEVRSAPASACHLTGGWCKWKLYKTSSLWLTEF